MAKQKQMLWQAAAHGFVGSLLLGASALLAQTGTQGTPTSVATDPGSVDAGNRLPTLTLDRPVVTPALSTDEPGVSSSAAQTAATDLALNTSPFHFVDAQYGGRRRYGKPRYRGGNSNADGSQKYTFFAGAGATVPFTTNSNYLSTSYGFQVGAGRNFNQHVGVNLQFDWDKFGFTGQTIATQYGLYSQLFNDPQGSLSYLDGNSHIWSFTLNPIYNIYSGEGLGAYVVAGGGFYHKTAVFTVPTIGTGYDYYYGYYQYQANQTIDSYVSNSAGVNGGVGLTYKFSKFANQRLYAEARLVHTFNSYRPPSTINSDGSVTGANFFPQNSLSTTYVPIKFGLRF